MKNIIFLKDFVEPVRTEALQRNSDHWYSPDLIDRAIRAMILNELRYNKTQGKTFNKSLGLRSEYVNKREIPHYESDQEAAKWEFTGEVRNAASRLKRQLNPF